MIGHQILVLHRLLDLLGEQRLQHFALDVVGKPATDQRNRRLARAKPGNTRDARELPRHAFHRLLHVFGGNFQLELAPASCFSHGSLGQVDFAFDYFEVERAPARLARAAILLRQHARARPCRARKKLKENRKNHRAVCENRSIGDGPGRVNLRRQVVSTHIQSIPSSNIESCAVASETVALIAGGRRCHPQSRGLTRAPRWV